MMLRAKDPYAHNSYNSSQEQLCSNVRSDVSMIPQAPLAGNNFERPLLMVKAHHAMDDRNANFHDRSCRRLHTYIGHADRSLDTRHRRTSNCNP